MNGIISFIIAFIVVYIIYLVFVVFNKRGVGKIKVGMEARFLQRVYKVDVSKINDRKFANGIAVSNSVIVAVAFYITNIFFDKAIFQILLSFPILVLLIIFLYSLLGRYYKKNE